MNVNLAERRYGNADPGERAPHQRQSRGCAPQSRIDDLHCYPTVRDFVVLHRPKTPTTSSRLASATTEPWL